MTGDILQMAVLPGREQSWADGDDLLCGFVVRAADVSWATSPAELFAAHALGFPGSPFSPQSTAIDVLRFAATPFTRLVSATGGTTAEGEPFGEGFVEPLPFTGTGFVATGGDHVVPLWWLEPSRVPAGAELWRIHADGADELIATYANVASGWQPAGAARFGPSDLVGVFAEWNGHPVFADILPNGRAVVASSTEVDGLRRTERGLWGGAIDPSEVAALHALRVTASWRGLPFQLVRRWSAGEALLGRLVYLGRDARAAESAGLQKMDAGVYEATAPISELVDLQAAELVPQT
jgi:hypothetical protein